MFQSYYDHLNDRWLVCPLRCASSHTGRLANALQFQTVGQIAKHYKKQGLIDYNPATESIDTLVDLITRVPQFENSKIVTIIRDPYSRYLSALGMIFPQKFGAPFIVDQTEIDTISKLAEHSGKFTGHHDTPYHYVDRRLEEYQKSCWAFDYSWGDSHLIPVVALQLMLYCIYKDRLEIVQLNDYDQWLDAHYPAGTNGLQPDFWHIAGKHVGYSKRNSNADIPLKRTQSIYNRFLRPIAWYNQEKINRNRLAENFYKFMWFERKAYEFFISDIDPEHKHANACDLYGDLARDPFFMVRDRMFYLTTVSLTSHLPHVLQMQIIKSMPDIQQYALKMSWLNIDNDAHL